MSARQSDKTCGTGISVNRKSKPCSSENVAPPMYRHMFHCDARRSWRPIGVTKINQRFKVLTQCSMMSHSGAVCCRLVYATPAKAS